MLTSGTLKSVLCSGHWCMRWYVSMETPDPDGIRNEWMLLHLAGEWEIGQLDWYELVDLEFRLR
jgi:hypothetical protein